MRKKKGFAALVLIFTVAVLGGCGVKVRNNTPESVVKSLLTCYQKQDEAAAAQCFGIAKDKKCPKDIQTEIEYNMKLFSAQDADGLKFKKADSLGDVKDKELIYVWYNCKVKVNDENKVFPAMAFYFVGQNEEGYYVVPAKDVTEEMGEMSGKEYKKFVKTDQYKKYDKLYKEFIKENPDYEKTLGDKLK